ncbi:hypothetical protein AMECASPLE_029064 [Ameca splendens]|uniref:Uncharacterized protein n=1 Tax=Ameca splendens TaxID=208324 RepID=A0ABV1ADD3_9TELE
MEEYLSRRLPALRRQSVCLQWLTPDSWIYLAEHRFRSQKFCWSRLPTFLMTLFPKLLTSTGFRSSWQLSCFLRFLDQDISVPRPPSNVSICILDNFMVFSSLLQTAPEETSEQTLLRKPRPRIPQPLVT